MSPLFPPRWTAREDRRSTRLATLAGPGAEQALHVSWVADAEPYLAIWLHFCGNDGWWRPARGRGFRVAARDLPALRAALDRALALAGAPAGDAT